MQLIRTKVHLTCECGFDEETALKFEVDVTFKSYCVESVEFWCQDECPECGAEVNVIASVGKLMPIVVWAKEEGGHALELMTDG